MLDIRHSVTQNKIQTPSFEAGFLKDSQKKSHVSSEKEKVSFLLSKILRSIGKGDYHHVLNTLIRLLGDFEESLSLEDKALWYEEMGRLCLKLKRHPNEACRYFRLALYALGILEDKAEIVDFIEVYDRRF